MEIQSATEQWLLVHITQSKELKLICYLQFSNKTDRKWTFIRISKNAQTGFIFCQEFLDRKKL